MVYTDDAACGGMSIANFVSGLDFGDKNALPQMAYTDNVA